MARDELGHASQEQARDATSSVRPQHDQISIPVRSRVDNRQSNIALPDHGIDAKAGAA
jgi:hypothetical protein